MPPIDERRGVLHYYRVIEQLNLPQGCIYNIFMVIYRHRKLNAIDQKTVTDQQLYFFMSNLASFPSNSLVS